VGRSVRNWSLRGGFGLGCGAEGCEPGGGVGGGVDPVQELGQRLTLHQKRGAHRDRGKQLQDLLGGAELEAEEVFQVASAEVGLGGVGDGAAEVMEAGSQERGRGMGASRRENCSAGATLKVSKGVGNGRAVAH